VNPGSQDSQGPKAQKGNLALQAGKDRRENHPEAEMGSRVKRLVKTSLIIIFTTLGFFFIC